MQGDDLYLYLCGDEGDILLFHLSISAAYLCGGDGDVLKESILCALHNHAVAHRLAQLFAQLCGALAKVLLHFLSRTDLCYSSIDLLLYGIEDLLLGDFDAVDGCLVQEELLYGQLLGDDAIGFSLDGFSLHHIV